MIHALANELRERLRLARCERSQTLVLVWIELDLGANHDGNLAFVCIHDVLACVPRERGPGSVRGCRHAEHQRLYGHRARRAHHRAYRTCSSPGVRQEGCYRSGARSTSISSSDHAPTRRQPELSLYRAPLSGPVRGCGPLRFPGHRASVPVPGCVGVGHSGAAPGSRSPRSPVQPAARGRGGAWTRRAAGTRGGVPGRAESCASLLPGDGMPPAARDVGSAGRADEPGGEPGHVRRQPARGGSARGRSRRHPARSTTDPSGCRAPRSP